MPARVPTGANGVRYAAVARLGHAVAIAGDMNTTGTNAAPTSTRREISRRASSLKFWLGTAIRYFSPVAIPQFGLLPINHFKIPTIPRHSISQSSCRIARTDCSPRWVSSALRTAARSISAAMGSEPGTSRQDLSHSNQRSLRGFTPTSAFERTCGGLVGSYKLDWIFVNLPEVAACPRSPLRL